MESRIKQLRENRGLIQEILASELGITQQMLSKYERDVLSNRTIKGIAVNGICVFLLCSRKRRTG